MINKPYLHMLIEKYIFSFKFIKKEYHIELTILCVCSMYYIKHKNINNKINKMLLLTNIVQIYDFISCI